ncbi:aspartate/glutamate racemase family protein [Alteribacillus sp. YIM 98480]|uniref:aspartate/glutamate racemase family protein n=1 Tax=Alteribacillus sp. YIM 98480 TaxID=2606599 RepID=UPI00131A9403|nr:aspartate/glutamate racemase family protein [Alteribacillus sp. YIM 98480]
MIYHAKKGQVNYGSTIGILMLDSHIPFIPGDMGNAATFSFPVHYKKVDGLTVKQMYEDREAVLPKVVSAGKQLIAESGVKAITGNCGYLLLFQQELASSLKVPVFMSSLLQLCMMEKIIDTSNQKIGIITAESYRLHTKMLHAAGIKPESVYVKGLENTSHFAGVAIQETGILNKQLMEQEVVEAAAEMITEHPDMSILLLECSLLSPYSKAVQEKIQRPVFDYVTMINFVFESFIKKEFTGFTFN